MITDNIVLGERMNDITYWTVMTIEQDMTHKEQNDHKVTKKHTHKEYMNIAI